MGVDKAKVSVSRLCCNRFVSRFLSGSVNLLHIGEWLGMADKMVTEMMSENTKCNHGEWKI